MFSIGDTLWHKNSGTEARILRITWSNGSWWYSLSNGSKWEGELLFQFWEKKEGVNQMFSALLSEKLACGCKHYMSTYPSEVEGVPVGVGQMIRCPNCNVNAEVVSMQLEQVEWHLAQTLLGLWEDESMENDE